MTKPPTPPSGEEPDDTAPEEERETLPVEQPWETGVRIQGLLPDLLHLARVVLPTRTLQVHYRSRYRELIAFSNASFYGNRLSVPGRILTMSYVGCGRSR